MTEDEADLALIRERMGEPSEPWDKVKAELEADEQIRHGRRVVTPEEMAKMPGPFPPWEDDAGK